MNRFEPDPLVDGRWGGLLTAKSAPRRVLLIHEGVAVAQADVVAAGDDLWRVTVALPATVLRDGTQSLLLVADAGGPDASADMALPGSEVLSRLVLLAGRPLEQDLQAEIALIRAELDLLKREFRRLATEG
ncbi:hypothetical protein MLD63_12970 [Paracoccus sp. TK19116]|uniref:SCP2 domain-containing protein n=1 Tax=Paracoccus albicereus TaxID=2922394 RepID=A0ABT1MSP0_9RHOB|nr:hypothetical protein [Paracoccus albicereus]MCQ0971335.1 hypothetical protein [Paracoccus albicereus]